MTGGAGPGAGGATEPTVAVGAAVAANGSRQTASTCGSCGEALVVGARFCEACGAATGGTGAGAAAAPAATAAAPAEELGGPADGPAVTAALSGDHDASAETPAVTFPPCRKCGGEVDGDGYCTTCGHRALEEVSVDDRRTCAYATHRGRRHVRNEDAAALGTTSEGWPVLVVSDGVSVSPNPHRASTAAAAAAVDRLAGRPFGGPDDLLAAVTDAHAAASAVPGDGDPYWPHDGTSPACTIVVAVATDSAVHVANVGDARAHLVTAAGDGWRAVQLTTDDSVAAQAVAQGIDAEVALNLPGGHGITAWLGADAHGLAPHLTTHPAGTGDVLLACSDGLWNYAMTDGALSELLTSMLPPPGTPIEPLAGLCERLVSWAIDQGGADNICVALAPITAAPSGDAHPPDLEDDE